MAKVNVIFELNKIKIKFIEIFRNYSADADLKMFPYSEFINYKNIFIILPEIN